MTTFARSGKSFGMRPCTVLLLGLVIVSCATWASADGIVFRSVLDNSPLDLTPKPGEVDTEAVKEFKSSGRTPYLGQPEALADGRRLYEARCQACHGRDGNGRLGPSLVADEPLYSRVTTDIGLFEIVYGGASGAMQPFLETGPTPRRNPQSYGICEKPQSRLAISGADRLGLQ